MTATQGTPKEREPHLPSSNVPASEVPISKQPPGEPTLGRHGSIEVVGGFSVGGLSERRIISLASAAPQGTDDEVDLALEDAVKASQSGMPVPRVPTNWNDPAKPERKYSLTQVADYPCPDGRPEDVIVMRGEVHSVVNACKTTREQRSLIFKNAQEVEMRGCRPLAVATARITEPGVVPPYTLQGFVTLRPPSVGRFEDDMAARPGDWVRVNLWSGLLRWQHWANVAVIFLLSCTGYYIMNPFFGPSFRQGVETGFLMGWFRLLHYICAFVWLFIGATRVYLLFTARDKFLRWPALFPLKSGADVKNLGRVAAYYLFIKKHAPLYIAHNPLQQLTYTVIYALGLLQMLSGLSLYALYHRANAFWGFVAAPIAWIGAPNIRLFHAMLMFVFWAFVIVHVYLAVRADSLERHGGVSSMLNGGVWIRRGSRPVDAPPID